MSVSDPIMRKLDPTLPSKFVEEDKNRLKDAFTTGAHRNILISNFIACLNDSLVISLGKKANLAKCKLITYGSCPPQSTVGQLLQSSVKYFLESLAILGEVGRV